MAKKTIAVVQSNYIPWRGYFDLINAVDEFILYDDMQYTVRDWRNRNLIKTPNGPLWLTIPVEIKGRQRQKIIDTKVSDPGWNQKHWRSIVHSYSRAEFFPMHKQQFEEAYARAGSPLLSRINRYFIALVCRVLGITTKISWSMDYCPKGNRTGRLVDLCRQTQATAYLSGPTAKIYLSEELFAREGITLSYMDYSDYPEYKQLYPPFEPRLSIIDLIFNEGPHATKYMKTF